jgi:hypothetical protein
MAGHQPPPSRTDGPARHGSLRLADVWGRPPARDASWLQERFAPGYRSRRSPARLAAQSRRCAANRFQLERRRYPRYPELRDQDKLRAMYVNRGIVRPGDRPAGWLDRDAGVRGDVGPGIPARHPQHDPRLTTGAGCATTTTNRVSPPVRSVSGSESTRISCSSPCEVSDCLLDPRVQAGSPRRFGVVGDAVDDGEAEIGCARRRASTRRIASPTDNHTDSSRRVVGRSRNLPIRRQATANPSAPDRDSSRHGRGRG